MARSAGSISPMEIRYPPATRTVRIHHALEKQGACVEFSHGPVVIVPGADEILVAPSELFPFDLFIGKGLDHTDPGQGILETGVDVDDLSPVVHEGLMLRAF